MCWLKLPHGHTISMDSAPCKEPLELIGVSWDEIPADCGLQINHFSNCDFLFIFGNWID
jgi:hypothetical protein